jgi:hypothetical protein
MRDASPKATALDGFGTRPSEEAPAASIHPVWLRAAAAIAFSLCSALAVVKAIQIAVLAYSPLPFADMWNELPFVRRTLAGDVDLSGWWAQHNEHRILLSRVQFIADFGLFGGRGLFLLGMIFLSCVLLAVLLVWPTVEVWNDRVVTLGFFAIAIWATLTPADWENITWSFQVGFVQVYLFAILAIVLLVFSNFGRSSGYRLTILAIIVLCGTGATLSNANGLTVWIALVFVSVVRKLNATTTCILVGVGVIEITVYLYHFHPVTQHASYSESLRQPLGIVRYVTAYLGHPAQPLGIHAAEGLGLAGLGLCVIFVVAAVRNGRRDGHRPVVFAAASAGFVVLTACQTAIGRLDFGVSQAFSSRYAIATAVFWVALAGGLAQVVAGSASVLVGPARKLDATALAFVSAGLAVAMCAGLAAAPDRALLVNAQASRNAVAAAYAGGVRNGSVLADVFAPPSALPDVLWLKRKHLGPWTSSELRRASSAVGTVRFQLLPVCPGHVDGVQPMAGAKRFLGWVATPSGARPSPYVQVVGADGTPHGLGYVGGYRPDVKQAGASSSNETGFVAFSRRPDDQSETLVAFADSGDRPLCAFPLSTG